MEWSPGSRCTFDGVLPTYAPSISTSAPTGFDDSATLAFTSGATSDEVESATGLGSSVLAYLCSDQSLVIAAHESFTAFPNDRVERLKIESPSGLKIAILLSRKTPPLPPS